MTIFGFNTDVRQGEVVYHVQSEARQSDLLLQTLVFVKGQCVGKRTFSYAHKTSQTGFSDEAMHELLKTQHKNVIDALEQGELGAVLGSQPDIQDVGGSGLSLKWSSSSQSEGATIVLQFQVLDSGHPAAGAHVSLRPVSPGDVSTIAEATADAAGNATVTLPLAAEVLRDSAVMAQAVYGGKSATCKVRFKK